ncbi:MAG: SRPBCC family protein [Anaerolineae bacterium]|nr:SRPBCC family protein [Anaerolineae bacterium]
MTTLIDQRILIPAPANIIWGVLADQGQLPRWRVDCQQVVVLTTRQFGVGTRRRCVNPNGKDKIEEITAWYEGLGYEYVLIGSRLYQNWRGRMRLQAVPEGTIVQWTITYDYGGIFSRVVGRLTGAKGRVEDECTASLRQLRRTIEQMGHHLSSEQRKSRTLQPVQSVVSASQQMKPVTVEDAQNSAADTKPRKPEGLAEAIAQQQPETPKTPPEAMTPSVPMTPVAPTELPVEPELSDTEPKKTKTGLPPGMPESLKATPPQGTPKVDISRLRYADEVDEEESPAPELAKKSATTTQIVRPGLPPPTGQDAGMISIWEAFGIKAPSQQDAEVLNEIVRQTREIKKVTIDEPLHSQDTYTFSPLYPSSILRVRPLNKTGLRSTQARAHVKVRRAKR